MKEICMEIQNERKNGFEKYIQNGDVKSHIQWRNVDSSFSCTKQIIQIAQKLNKKVPTIVLR